MPSAPDELVSELTTLAAEGLAHISLAFNDLVNSKEAKELLDGDNPRLAKGFKNARTVIERLELALEQAKLPLGERMDMGPIEKGLETLEEVGVLIEGIDISSECKGGSAGSGEAAMGEAQKAPDGDLLDEKLEPIEVAIGRIDLERSFISPPVSPTLPTANLKPSAKAFVPLPRPTVSKAIVIKKPNPSDAATAKPSKQKASPSKIASTSTPSSQVSTPQQTHVLPVAKQHYQGIIEFIPSAVQPYVATPLPSPIVLYTPLLNLLRFLDHQHTGSAYTEHPLRTVVQAWQGWYPGMAGPIGIMTVESLVRQGAIAGLVVVEQDKRFGGITVRAKEGVYGYL